MAEQTTVREQSHALSQQGDLRPIPDPTTLTLSMIQRELAALKEIIFARLEGVEQLSEEKFRFIEMRFVRRDHETEMAIAERKEAVRDALTTMRADITGREESLKQASMKSETGFTKQIDQLTALFQTAISAQSEQLGDIKERVLLIEGRTSGINSAQTALHSETTVQHSATGNIMALIGVIIAALGVATGILVAVLHR